MTGRTEPKKRKGTIMRSTSYLLAGVLVVLAVFVSGAYGSLVGDPAALTSGSQSFGTPVWAATVEYAVYAPGMYPGAQADKASDYVYAYQVFSDAASIYNLDQFSLSLATGAFVVHAGFDSTFGTLAGIDPLLSTFIGTPPSTGTWALDIPAGQHSSVLTFASPNTYTLTSAIVANGGNGASHPLPSPLPEPATISLLVLGGLAAIRRRAV